MIQSPHQHPALGNREDDQACTSCHLEEGIGQSRLTNGGTTKITDPSLRNIHIVKLSNLTPSTKYKFRIQSTDAGQKTVAMESDDFFFTTASIPSKPIPSLSENSQDSTPVEIMGVTIGEIIWGPLISIKVSWKTDKPSTSKVEYGITPSFGFTTPVDFSPVVDHNVTIHGLRPGTTYYFRVYSVTPSGNQTTSNIQTFTTPSSKLGFYFQKISPLLEWITPSAVAQSKPVPLFITNISISEITDRSAMITWETNRSSDTLLEYRMVQPTSETKSFIHPPLKSKEKVGLETCYGCHPKEKLGKSHPVKVSLRPEMKRTCDLPLGERDTLLCTTCHDPHGGSSKFLARKDWKKELCISCHDPKNPFGSPKIGSRRR